MSLLFISISAVSMLAPSLNSRMTMEEFSLETESIPLTLLTVAMVDSRGLLTVFSTSSGLAPT